MEYSLEFPVLFSMPLMVTRFTFLRNPNILLKESIKTQETKRRTTEETNRELQKQPENSEQNSSK